MSIGAGQREHLVSFELPAVTPDGHGGQHVTGWIKVMDAWCRVTPLSAFEQMRAMRLQMPVTHEITVPWCIELAQLSPMEWPKHRANFNGRVLNIISATETDEAHIEFVLLAEEGVPT